MNLLDHSCARRRAPNRLANHRLHAAMPALVAATNSRRARTGFFPSLAATLNHILAVDIYYIAALHGEADMARQYDALRAVPSMSPNSSRASAPATSA